MSISNFRVKNDNPSKHFVSNTVGEKSNSLDSPTVLLSHEYLARYTIVLLLQGIHAYTILREKTVLKLFF